jgi:hypothetical protein
LIIAAILLPLPFAALPMVSVFLPPIGPHDPGAINVSAAAEPQYAGDADTVATTGNETAMTFRSGDRNDNCFRISTSAIEG